MSVSRSCPVCATSSELANLYLDSTFNIERINKFSYASRKIPEYMNHKLVRCPTCDLVYANEPPARHELSSAYQDADYDSAEEAGDAALAYLVAIRPILVQLKKKSAVLEIGTGTGVFLDLLQSAGFARFVGIEPSSSAIAAAPPHRRIWIKHGVFEDQHLAPMSFDLVCCFMTMEHVLDPKLISDEVMSLLRPGGAFVTVTHDYQARVNRIMGKRSPIVDIEHLQLFSDRSIAELFRRSGYQNISTRCFKNRYAVAYWWRLLPVPAFLKNAFASFLGMTHLGRIKLSLNVGNILCVGFRPVV